MVRAFKCIGFGGGFGAFVGACVTSGVTVLGGVVLWALWPQLAPALATLSQGLAPLGAALAVGVGAVMLLGGQIEPTFPREV